MDIFKQKKVKHNLALLIYMNKITFKIITFLLGAFLALVASADTLSPLPAEKAFVFSAYLKKPHQLIVEWQIAPGAYLYRNKLHIVSTPAHPTVLGPIGWPKTKIIYLHGKTKATRVAYQVLQGKARVYLPLQAKAHKPFTIAISYQGCTEDGFCYAPVKKLLHLAYPFAKQGLQNAPLLTISHETPLFSASSVTEKAVFKQHFMTDQKATSTLMSHHQFVVIVLCFLVLGLLLAFTPCSLPMIPILSSIIVGQKSTTAARSFYLSLSYVLGTALTYALAGIMMAWLGTSIQIYFQNPWIITAFSWIFIFLALSMLGVFELRFPGGWQQKIFGWQEQQRNSSYWGSFIMGSLSTLIVSPCVTAPVVGVLAYVTETGNLILGGVALFALGLGMGLPMLALGFSIGKYLPKAGPWMETIKKLFAFLLLGMSIWLLSRIVPGGLALFFWACLFMTMAVYLFFVVALFKGVWRYLGYACGLFLSLYGLTLFIGVGLSYTSPFYPFERLYRTAQQQAAQPLVFITVKSMPHLQVLLQQAKKEKKSVMVDFYASWCESCRVMEKSILNAPAIREKLQQFIVIRADVTKNDTFDQVLLKHYKVVAPPTFLFLNREGVEWMNKRIVGEVDEQTFLKDIEML